MHMETKTYKQNVMAKLANSSGSGRRTTTNNLSSSHTVTVLAKNEEDKKTIKLELNLRRNNTNW